MTVCDHIFPAERVDGACAECWAARARMAEADASKARRILVSVSGRLAAAAEVISHWAAPRIRECSECGSRIDTGRICDLCAAISTEEVSS